MTSFQEKLDGFGGKDADARRQTCARYVEAARESILRRHEQGADPGELLADLSRGFDALLGALYRAAAVPDGTYVSLIALGGYGRGELYPHSDLDLLILHDGGEGDLTARLVEAVIYPLWDARVSVGHAVRTQEETLELAGSDLTVCTSLLDARMLAGDEGPYHALRGAALRRFFGPSRVADFVDSLKEERGQRHRRFGETVYLLEPNIKSCKGGLRDLNTGLWAAKARLGVTALEEVDAAGGSTRRQTRVLLEAQRFLRTLRLEMHLRAGRSQDQLNFELQEALAPILFPDEEVPGSRRQATPAVEPAVERLMHAFYRHARAVVLETDGLMERLTLLGEDAPTHEEKVTSAEDEHLVLAGRHIHSLEPERFWERPAEILRAMRAAQARGLRLDRRTSDAVAEAAAGGPGMQLLADGEAADQLMEILCSPQREEGRTALEQLHDLGVLAALVPEWEPCTGRVQHDLYHVYTVDQHSLFVVALIRSWLRGEQAEVYPGPVAAAARVSKPEGLLLGALLHDVAKPLGHGHAERGARLAAGVAARLGLSDEQQRLVRVLVGHHLVMAHLSQRRDLSDPAVISRLAALVGSEEVLRCLYLLTAADTAMTAPGNLNDWKTRLLDELYMQTYSYLLHGEGELLEQRAEEVVDRRDALELNLRRAGHGEAGAALVRRLPEGMVLAFPTDDLLHHLQAALASDGGPPPLVRLLARRAGAQSTELTICCPDSPGLLADITGVMTAHGVEVLGAQVFTLEPDEGGEVRALDVFTVGSPVADGDPWSALTADLERALRGELAVDETVARHTRPSGLPPRVVPRVAVEVHVNNDVSERFSVVEVQAPDGPGVLHAITRTLSRLGLSIHLSRVATEAGRVVDIFYVGDGESGGKVTGEAREQVKGAVAAAIEGLGRRRDEGDDEE